MELNEHDHFLEELLAFSRDASEGTIPIIPPEMNEFLSGTGCGHQCYEENQSTIPQTSFCEGFSSLLQQDFNSNYCIGEVYCPFGGELPAPQFTDEFSAAQFTDSSYNTLDTPPFPVQEDTPMSIMEDEELGLLANDQHHNLEMQATCKVETIHSPEAPVFCVGTFPERKIRGKKLEGQPSKNLMAERRRRKRLNDRLSMLRSIVPKISKMDRTSILADTIDYMKELLERINSLQGDIEVNSDEFKMLDIFKDTKTNEIIARNSPKFDVERKNMDTRIEITCAAKPGLLLSTVNTLEALGLEIQQCVISCFNEFSMQASCSEEMEQRTLASPEDIKQALFRNAGYGGRCL